MLTRNQILPSIRIVGVDDDNNDYDDGVTAEKWQPSQRHDRRYHFDPATIDNYDIDDDVDAVIHELDVGTVADNVNSINSDGDDDYYAGGGNYDQDDDYYANYDDDNNRFEFGILFLSLLVDLEICTKRCMKGKGTKPSK